MNKLYIATADRILKSDNPEKELTILMDYLEGRLTAELNYYKELKKEAGYE